MIAAATTAPAPFDAVVLAGGAARRLGGADKPQLEVGGTRLLDRVLRALEGAGRVVVVGPERPVAHAVSWTWEDPPGAGPAAAVAAGLELVSAPHVVVVAADLPFLDAATVCSLRAAATGRDGALLVDDDGREQLLAGCWSTAALQRAVRRTADDGGLEGAAVRRLLDGLDRAHVGPGRHGPPAWLDCDTPDDLRRARERA